MFVYELSTPTPDPDCAPAPREAAAVLALVEAARDNIARLADVVETAGSALAVVEGRALLRGRAATIARTLAARIDRDTLDDWARVLGQTLARSPNTRIVTVTDPDYPTNLRRVAGRPLFLFVRGDLRRSDARAVAVVGTRQASRDGLAAAGDISATLAQAGITVVSGLAAGVDTAAHRAALAAGGRTVASIGTGVDRVFPQENSHLAETITRVGALVSRFWPDAPPRSASFPMRNVVTSGLALATVIVEAGPTSGARLQARLALEQQRPVILLERLVEREAWARRYAGRRGTIVAATPSEILAAVQSLEPTPSGHQLALF
jgi:DNA processing protein